MSVDHTSRRQVLRMALIAFAVLASPAAASAEPSQRVVRYLGSRAAEILARASRVEVFRVVDKRAGENQKSVGGYVVTGAGTEIGAPASRRLADLLLDEKSYRFDHSTVGGFTPLVGLRLWDGERSVEVLLSFATDEVVVFSRNPDDASVRSAQADVLPARGVLVELVKQALPDDKPVQAIESSAAGGKTLSPSTGTVPR
jgi:hypothetical protein